MKAKAFKYILLAAAACFAAGSAQAQVVSIGTTAGGANAQVGASIAGVVSSNTDVRMRPQKTSGSQQVIEAVSRGRMQFGVANAMQYYMAVTGTGLSEGAPKQNLRLAATLMRFINGVLVRADSGIDSIAELRGKRIPAGYASSPLFVTFWEAFLATEGLSYDDVEGVPVASLPKSWGAFKEGQVDAVIAAAGAAAVREMDAVIPGGVRYLSIKETPQLLKAMPATRIETVEPAKHLDGIVEPTQMHVYEYVLFTNADVDEQTVRQVVAAISGHEQALRASTPLWNTYVPANIALNHGLDYHPGAVKYFKQQGLWRR
jgi:TRAP transporter TAXI family solute receptor